MNKIKDTDNSRTISNCGCAKCQLLVTNEGIQCDTCDKWFHSHCSKLTKLALKLCTHHKFLKWVWTSCTTKIKKSQASKHINVGKATTSKTRSSVVAAPPSASNDCVSSRKRFLLNDININSLSLVVDASLSSCRSRAHSTLIEPALLVRKMAHLMKFF